MAPIAVYESAVDDAIKRRTGQVRDNNRVRIVEPFHAYHHRRGIKFFPPSLSTDVEALIQRGDLALIKVDDINAKEIYFLAADKAVEVVESVYPVYREDIASLVDFVVSSVESPRAEDAFKKTLCDRLANFYSVNILLHRIGKRFEPSPCIVYPDTDVHAYEYFKSLLTRAGQDFYDHRNVQLAGKTSLSACVDNIRRYLISVGAILVQAGAGYVPRLSNRSKIGKKKKFKYGFSILSPRQLASNQRGPNFLFDGKKISPDETVYFPTSSLRKKQGVEIENKLNVVTQPRSRQAYPRFCNWKKLLWLSLRLNPLKHGEELFAALITITQYLGWKQIMESIELKHFITHGDFGISHIGRNIALNQAGVQTWYFTDSMNSALNFSNDGQLLRMRHPFWSYLLYDRFVTWCESLADYYLSHPGTFKRTHVIGCLWADHVNTKSNAWDRLPSLTREKMKDKFIVSVFDSTYSNNGYTSYREGITFARDILRLAEEFPDIHVLFKEKKVRSIHLILDAVNGPRLIEAYDSLSAHPRISVHSDNDDSSLLTSVSDMVVSFPFTSTTFEALSANKPAVWHDPLGLYRDTPYAKVGGVVTHGYDELRQRIRAQINGASVITANPIPDGSPLMDPYRDGKAIERFRELLTATS